MAMSCGFRIGTIYGWLSTLSQDDAIVILEVYSKKTQSTPSQVIAVCRKRLAAFVKAAANWEQE